MVIFDFADSPYRLFAVLKTIYSVLLHHLFDTRYCKSKEVLYFNDCAVI